MKNRTIDTGLAGTNDALRATARGFRDVLPTEGAERAVVETSLLATFAAWGYRRVETPVVEELATLEAGAGPLEGEVFMLFDQDGSLLALRPEMTVPIARLVASRLGDADGPVRAAYAADVFREQASLRGQSRQFRQAGVELVGVGGSAADAEVVIVLAEALAATGLPSFTVGMGTVALQLALLEGAEAADRAAILSATHARDIVGFERAVRTAGLDAPVAEALLALPRLRGGDEAIARARELAAAAGCADALDGFADAWTLVAASDQASRVVVDFGISRSFDYYTGLVVEAYAPGLGLPLGGGGRYDGVLAAMGRPAPAAGFALGLERVHIALSEAGAAPRPRGLDAVIGGETAIAALQAAAALRRAGWNVAVAAETARPALPAAALAADAASAWWATAAGAVGTLAPDGTIATAVDVTDPPEPPTEGGCLR